PRWPECHVPAWAKSLPVDQRQKEALVLVQKVVERYKDNGAVWAWQVENEPLFKAFGEGCDMLDMNFLKNEIALVRSNSNKPIIMTDSGELGLWVTSMRMSDIFGTTVYRQVYDKWLGYVTYPVPASFYSVKSNLVRYLFAKSNQKTIVTELQTEPWFANGDFISPEEQTKIFTTQDLKNYVNFSRGIGFDEVYLWGVEWWYFMAGQGHSEYLEYARTLF
ncbi:MAG: beta-galactosidase, partial [Candidatus Daviesbacteria bacterium]|nr:beta-galactosidase [Candidatus Daviesbacteria bacterium]